MSIRSISTFFSVLAILFYTSFLLFLFSDPGLSGSSEDKLWIYLFLIYPYIVFVSAFLSSIFKLPQNTLHLLAVLLTPFLVLSLFLATIRPFYENSFEFIPLLLGTVFTTFNIVWYFHYFITITRRSKGTDLLSFNIAQNFIAVIKRIIYPTSLAFLAFLILVVFDMHIFRGYLFEKVFLRYKTDFIANPQTVNFKYLISQNSDSTWNFYLKNNEPYYRYILCYRNNQIDFKLTDKLLIGYANRVKFDLGDKILEDDAQFFCGTGLAPILIRPYEEFNWNFSNIYDLVYEHHYITSYDKEINTDSIKLQFFLPVYALNSAKPFRVYSNSINISYNRLMNVLHKKKRVYKLESTSLGNNK